MTRYCLALTMLLLSAACETGRRTAAYCEPECVMALDTVVRLSFDTLYAPDASPAIAVGTQRIAVSSSDAAGEVYVFDRAGRLLRVLGRAGGGPGEFRRIAALLYDAGDTLFVFDAGHRRVTVYGPSHEMLRELALPPARLVGSPTWASDTVLFVQTARGEGGRTRFAAHLLSKSGGAVRVVEMREPPDPQESMFDARPAARRLAGGVWLGEVRSLAVVRYDQEGNSVAGFTIPDHWRPDPPRNADLYTGVADVRPALLALTEDPAGRLWLLSGEPEDPLPHVRFDESFEISDDLIRRMADHTIHVVDPTSGRVLVEERYDLLELKLLDGGYGYLVDEERGEVVIVRLRMEAHTG